VFIESDKVFTIFLCSYLFVYEVQCLRLSRSNKSHNLTKEPPTFTSLQNQQPVVLGDHTMHHLTMHHLTMHHLTMHHHTMHHHTLHHHTMHYHTMHHHTKHHLIMHHHTMHHPNTPLSYLTASVSMKIPFLFCFGLWWKFFWC